MFKQFILALSLITVSISSFAYDSDVCKNNKSNIEKQIQDAKRYNNHNKVKNLEKALERVNKACKATSST